MRRTRLKIYGERNTGTLYLHALCERNLNVILLRHSMPVLLQRLFPLNERVRDLYFRLTRFHNLGWKHALALPRPRSPWQRNTRFVTLTKNPYSFLLSLYRNPYHAARPYRDFIEFLQSPWRTVGREHGPTEFRNPIDLWNRKNASYLELARHVPVLHLRYEDLLADPLNTVGRIARHCAARPRRTPLENVEASTKEKGKDSAWYRDYYLRELWREKLSDEAVGLINEWLDESLLRQFGYQRLPAKKAARAA